MPQRAKSGNAAAEKGFQLKSDLNGIIYLTLKYLYTNLHGNICSKKLNMENMYCAMTDVTVLMTNRLVEYD